MGALVSLDAETVRRLMHTSSDVLCSKKGDREGMKRKRDRGIRAAKRESTGHGWMHHALAI